jgi:ATP-dependent Clp protease protease subunit
VRAELETVLASHTGQTVETLRRDTDRDRVFTAEAARDYGLIDEVLPPRSAAVQITRRGRA